MNTLEFLQAVLPAGGTYFVVVIKDSKTIHHHFADLDEMSQAIERLTASRKQQVYHGCAAYCHADVPGIDAATGKPRNFYRTQDNWKEAKAFWLDIDCGEEKAQAGKGYATKKDGQLALWRFAKDIGWPAPMLVDSGFGLHCYWPLTEAIDPDTWRAQAALLKAATHHFGLLADPTRTADFASILRPAGSVNRKLAGARPVTVKYVCTPQPPQILFDALHAALPPQVLRALPAPGPATHHAPEPLGLNNDLLAHLPMRLESSGALAADKCKQLGDTRKSCGDVDFPTWRGVLGLLKNCTDGQALAPQWTSKRLDTGHSKDDWAGEMASWNAGATTCAYFESNNPKGCEKCPHKGLITSPVQLGRIAPVLETSASAKQEHTGIAQNTPENTTKNASDDAFEDIAEDTADDTTADIAADIAAELGLPEGYLVDTNTRKLCRLVTGKSGELKIQPFCSHLFFPYQRIKTADGKYRLGICMHIGKEQKPRHFEIATESLASDAELLRALAPYELTRSKDQNSGVNMSAYMRDQFDRLKQKSEEINTFRKFGWHDDNTAFLLGGQLYLSDGTVKEVHLSGNAEVKAPHMHAPKGTAQGYAQALNAMYNRPGMEHYQYVICAGWGSILTPMGQDHYHGILLTLVGGKSSKGKSTVCTAAMRAFGDPQGMTLSGQLGSTLSRRYSTFSTMGSLPVLLDEITGYEDKAVSDLAYAVSLGEDKQRMTIKNKEVLMAAQESWNLNVYATGNRDFYGVLANNLANSEAEAMRLIQVDIDKYPVVRNTNSTLPYEFLSEAEKKKVDIQEQGWINGHVDQMKANEGSAGAVMVQYVVTHYEEVKAEVKRRAEALCHTVSDSRFRFFRDQFACALTMARIAKEQGIIGFDLVLLEAYIEQLFKELYETINDEITRTPADSFNSMVNAMRENFLVTSELRDGRHKNGVELKNQFRRGEITGRYIQLDSKQREFAGHLYLSKFHAKSWCTKNRIALRDIEKYLADAGALLDPGTRFSMCQGTDCPPVQTVCMQIDMGKLEIDLSPLQKGDKNEPAQVD